MRTVIMFMLFILSSTAGASGETEGVRQYTRVGYTNGDFVEVSCSTPDVCSISVSHRGEVSRFEAPELDGLIILPSNLALVAASPGRSVVEVEVGCAEYAESPPGYICVAQFEMVRGSLSNVSVFKRTFIESSDSHPFRTRPVP